MSNSDDDADTTVVRKRTALGLALALETACQDFDVLRRLVRQELALVGHGGPDLRASSVVTMALAKSFVFHAARALRLCEQGARVLDLPKDERKAFTNGMKNVSLVRDVNEHGADPKDHPRRKNARPAIHVHDAGSAALDETSLIIFGDEKILMGPINLCDAYLVVARFRAIAGYSSLPPEYVIL